ncbi:MAG: hypothetical protein A2Y62_20260 [Candidatus Fischerbacteria bacterium RBG_13_37_8]|uniref:NADH:ubiquinone oxidoreductase-like 20kDa subunit domain-containing protein n=1 Tax=Candidatus Fischerbacteria bacterium RBG_13_37_8 TaxID=1817863 RepID=A0A1F5VFD8_9BACT|nr:MAG: hypothetical protein A2Y62_20260 [Candidatus Fischerbacteria bacterium RBG_13_37_8]
MSKNKLRIGVYGLTGCAGDQLTILNCEDRLLKLFETVDVRSFLMAKSDNLEEELDIALVEGSVSTRSDEESVINIRQRTGSLVAIGICACFGGIQAVFTEPEEWAKQYEQVYGNRSVSSNAALQSRPVKAFVKVDYYLPGCPIHKEQFLALLSRLALGSTPEFHRAPVCLECKWQENDCLLNKNVLCLGPLTTAGCGAICPTCNLPCVGCWGPFEEANCWSEWNLLLDKDYDRNIIMQKMKSFSGTGFIQFFNTMKKERT